MTAALAPTQPAAEAAAHVTHFQVGSGGRPVRLVMQATARLSQDVPRRLVAVLHADMAGYSRLIGMDAAGTLQRLRTLRDRVIVPTAATYGGRIVHISGDEFLLEFSSTTQAVSCALWLQQQIQALDTAPKPALRMRFRIGVNIGEVLSDGSDIHGDGVNVAARLQALAPVGGICVSRAVRDQITGWLDLKFRPIGLLRLKNIARPIEAFSIDMPTSQRQHRRFFGLLRQTLYKATPRACLRWIGLVILLAVAPEITGFAGANSLVAAQFFGRTSPPPRLSVAVLPFENLSSQPRLTLVADAITDDLTMFMRQIPGAFVPSREAGRAYAQNHVSGRQTGLGLAARYALEGSVQVDNHIIHLSVQLTSAARGARLWTSSVAFPAAGAPASAYEAVRKLGGVIEQRLLDLEADRLSQLSPNQLAADDYLVMARALGTHLLTMPRLLQMRHDLEQGLRLHPDSVPIKLFLARTIVRSLRFADQTADVTLARTLVEAAGQADPEAPLLLLTQADVLRAEHHFDEALAAYRRLAKTGSGSASINASLVGRIALCLLGLGRAEDALAMLRDAEARAPEDRGQLIDELIGETLLRLRRDEHAIPYLQRSVSIGGSDGRLDVHAELAAAYAHAGRLDDARRELSLAPAFLTRRFLLHQADATPEMRQQLDWIIDGLSLAGLRDHEDAGAVAHD